MSDLRYSLASTRPGITIPDPLEPILSVGPAAANTSGEVIIRATNSAGQYSDARVMVTVGSQSSSVLKWYPGHYMAADSALTRLKVDGLNAAIDRYSVLNTSTVPGMKLIVPWGQIEQTTRGVYDWSILDNAIARITANGRKVYFDIWWQEFVSETSTLPTAPQDKTKNYLPDYLIAENLAYLSIPVSGIRTRGVRMWQANAMDEFIRFITDVAARYDDDPRVAACGVGEGSWAVPQDGSATRTQVVDGTLAQCRRLASLLRSIFVHTPFFLYNNFTGDQSVCGTLVEDQKTTGVGMAVPDIKPQNGSIDPAVAAPSEWNYRYARGERWNGTTWIAGVGPDIRTDLLCLAEKQVIRSTAWTPSLVYQLTMGPNSYRPHFMVWQNPVTAYLAGSDPPIPVPAMNESEVIKWFQTQTSATVPTRTDMPASLGSITPEIKWNPGHYMQDRSFDQPTRFAHYDSSDFASNPNVKGVSVFFRWNQLEGATRGDYSAGMALVQAELTKLQSLGKKLILRVMDRKYDSTPTLAETYCPAYMSTAGYVVLTSNTVHWKRYDATAMGYFIDMLNAYGQAFDSHPAMEMVCPFQESSYAAPVPSDPAYSDAAINTQYRRLALALRTNWPTCQVWMPLNWNPYNDMVPLMTYCRDNLIAIGNPDTCPDYNSGGMNVGMRFDKQLRGELGGIDFRNTMSIVYAVEDSNLGYSSVGGASFTAQQHHTFRETYQKVNYHLWDRNTYIGTSDMQWSPGILAVINTQPTANTQKPPGY